MSASKKRARSEPPVCAPSENLNTGFKHFPTAKEVYAHIRNITLPGGEKVVRNFVCVIEVCGLPCAPACIPTALAPRGRRAASTPATSSNRPRPPISQDHFDR
jgi:hypothetical protein